MADPNLINIINYLKDNKGKYSKESLISALKNAGYNNFQINIGVPMVYENNYQARSLIHEDDKKEDPAQKEKQKRLSMVIAGSIVVAWFFLNLFDAGWVAYIGSLASLIVVRKNKPQFNGVFIGFIIICLFSILGLGSYISHLINPYSNY
jgi:hypothetical protein